MGSRSALRPRDHGLVRPAHRPDRAHRGGARAALQPLRLRGHRRGHPDLYPQGRRGPDARGSAWVAGATAPPTAPPASPAAATRAGATWGQPTSQTNGFNACDGCPGVAGCFTDEPDRDGYRNLSGQRPGGLCFGDLGEVDVHLLARTTTVALRRVLCQQRQDRSAGPGRHASLRPLDPWDLNLAAGRSWDDSDNSQEGPSSPLRHHPRHRLPAERLALGLGQILTLGVD